jgi:hypothetical protein
MSQPKIETAFPEFPVLFGPVIDLLKGGWLGVVAPLLAARLAGD